MTDLKVTDNALTACFVFPADFIGFQGHFPQKKLLPGVCQIQCITCMLEKWKKNRVSLKEIVSAKFLSPVLPSEEITCECREIQDNGGEIIVRAFISRTGGRVAEMKLRVSLSD
jgi:3-hydroxyacyl-[acyl-carrier-protein] dehydratase